MNIQDQGVRISQVNTLPFSSLDTKPKASFVGSLCQKLVTSLYRVSHSKYVGQISIYNEVKGSYGV